MDQVVVNTLRADITDLPLRIVSLFTLANLRSAKYTINRIVKSILKLLSFIKNNELVFTTKCFLRIVSSEKYFVIGNKSGGYNEFRLVSQTTGVKKYGGERIMLCCPDCGRKVIKIFLRPLYYNNWKCRKCQDLTHNSSKESRRPGKFERMIAAMSGVSVQMVRRSLRSLRYSRYINDYFLSTIFTEETFMKQVGFKLSEYEIKEIQKLSKELDLSRSEIIRRAIDYYIDFLKMQKGRLDTK